MQHEGVDKEFVFEQLLLSLEGLCNAIQDVGSSLSEKERNAICDDLESSGFAVKKIMSLFIEKKNGKDLIKCPI